MIVPALSICDKQFELCCLIGWMQVTAMKQVEYEHLIFLFKNHKFHGGEKLLVFELPNADSISQQMHLLWSKLQGENSNQRNAQLSSDHFRSSGDPPNRF